MYTVYLQQRVDKKLAKLKKRERIRHQAINESIKTLITDPFTDSVPLLDQQFRGFRRIKAGIDRVIFQICSECRADQTIKKKRNCSDCESMPENAIKVFDIPPRKNAY